MLTSAALCGVSSRSVIAHNDTMASTQYAHLPLYEIIRGLIRML